MSFKDDLEKVGKLWGQSSWPSRGLLALAVVTSSASIAGLSDIVVKWKGAINIAIEFYQNTIPLFITKMMSYVGVDITRIESDAIVVATIWIASMSRFYKLKYNYDLMLSNSNKDVSLLIGVSESMRRIYSGVRLMYSNMPLWKRLGRFINVMKKWFFSFVLYVGFVLWLMLDQVDSIILPIMISVLYFVGLILLFYEYRSIPSLDRLDQLLSEEDIDNRASIESLSNLRSKKLFSLQNLYNYSLVPVSSVLLLIVLSGINHGIYK